MERTLGLTIVAGLLLSTAMLGTVGAQRAAADALDPGECETPTPSGKCITPTAAPGSTFVALDPELKEFPKYRSGQAISTAVSPDGKTLLVLTSGNNQNYNPDNEINLDASAQYVFVYDISGAHAANPQKKQVLKILNTFAGIAFAPDGKSFYVSGGGSDDVHSFTLQGASWKEFGQPIQLGHKLPEPAPLGTTCGLGYNSPCTPGNGNGLSAGGLAFTADGRYLIVANIYNDSLTVIDVKKRQLAGPDIQLRPGLVNPKDTGKPGGEYPFWVAVTGNGTAYVSSIRDREVVVVSLTGKPTVVDRIQTKGMPNKMILNRDQSLLFVAEDNSDLVSVVDTKTNKIVASVKTTAPDGLLDQHLEKYTGSTPNSLTLSPDERTLYVTNGNTSSVAVIRVGNKGLKVVGLIPTGWYPNAVSLDAAGKYMYVLNGKSPAKANPNLFGPDSSGAVQDGNSEVRGENQYVYQMEQAGFLTLPVPGANVLDHLTRIVAANNGFKTKTLPEDAALFAALHGKIKHVIYSIRENRTYDQILGDLPIGNGDPSITMYPYVITPNLHRLATKFVLLDNLYLPGEVSGDGWPWSTSAREQDFGLKAMPSNYSYRPQTMPYDYEGTNRDINIGVGTVAERQALDPNEPDDPNLLPGTANNVEPDGPEGTKPGKGYIWDAVLRTGQTFRNYGSFGDTRLDAPLVGPAYQQHAVQSEYANPELQKYGDTYYRGYDNCYPDYWRINEWKREFEQFIARGDLPNLMTVQLPMDHMGCFGTNEQGQPNNIGGLTTANLQQADGDYALGWLVDLVAKSPYKDSTVIIAIEDDAQNGPDHVSAVRSTIYFAGPYIKQGAVVSEYYTTVNVLRTIEDLLGTDHLNLNTATARPMSAVFDLAQKDWDFNARPADVLYQSTLPLPPKKKAELDEVPAVQLTRLDPPGDWWKEQSMHLDFSEVDHIDADAFNRIQWEGTMGDRPYPTERSGANLRENRQALLDAEAARTRPAE